MLVLFLTVGWAFTSCDTEYRDSGEHSGVYDSGTNANLTEILFFISPYVMDNGEKKYLVTDELQSVTIQINNKAELTNPSLPFNQDKLTDRETLDSYEVSRSEIKYPVIIDLTQTKGDPITAGDYADILNRYNQLLPGAYICRIVSFTIRTNEGIDKTIYTPTLATAILVEEGITSLFLGEFEVEIQ